MVGVVEDPDEPPEVDPDPEEVPEPEVDPDPEEVPEEVPEPDVDPL